MKKPVEVEVIAYQVGFGDCFLMKVHYATGRPHTVLIDFGSTETEHFTLSQIAKQVKADCEGKLDVVVATHRHKDHVHGFTRTKQGGGTGKVIRDLSPSVVIQPWTEDPKIQPDAKRPAKMYGAQGPALAARLLNMQSLAGSIEQFSKRLGFRSERDLRRRLRVLGDNNLGNAAAMANLRSMGTRQYYAYHGMKLGLARELPGVTVHVLGPPTLEQTTAIENQRQRDEDEFWHLQARAGSVHTDQVQLFPDHRTLKNPVWARWARRRWRRSRADEMLSIVRSLDHAMNNTSVILVFQVGKKRLLFPGDAQYENWMYALGKAWVRKLLKGVDVYKVGHHGSLNATPKSMFDLFEKKRDSAGAAANVMHSLLSTKPKVHGDPVRRTEVPRASLVRALRDETQLHATTDLAAGAISTSIRMPV